MEKQKIFMVKWIYYGVNEKVPFERVFKSLNPF